MTIYNSPKEILMEYQYRWFMPALNGYKKLEFNGDTIISDDGLLTENIYVIAKYFLGDNHRTIIDDSIYRTQRKYFVDKFLVTFLFIKNIVSFSIVKFSIIRHLINLEYEEDNSHIMTFDN